MLTLKTLVDNIYAIVNLSSDDTNLDRRSVKFWIKNKRAMLIKRRLSERQFHSANYKQSIPCLELELHDRSLSTCCSDLTVGCSVLRSVQKLPTLLSYRGKEDLIIRPLDVISHKFSFVTHDTWIYSGNSRYNSNDVFATIVDGYLYVKSNNKGLQTILGKYLYLEGVFEDPEELGDFINCNDGTACYSDQQEFPIEQDMVDIITKDILQLELNINLNTSEDNTNDSEDDKTAQSSG